MSNQCCQRLSLEEWDKKEIVWRDKPFYKDHYRSFFHVPVNFGKKIVRGLERVKESGLEAEQMVLCKNDSPWGADLLIPISQKTDKFNVELLNGRFITRLFEGYYGEIKAWIKETKRYCHSKNLEPKEYIFWYATCPKCAKKFGGKVQMVILARVE